MINLYIYTLRFERKMQSMLWLKEQMGLLKKKKKKNTMKYMSLNKGVQPAPKWHVNMMKSKSRML